MDLSPRQIVAELDRFIIGQNDAKKAVAVALRNRYRRSRLAPELREEITPKNIIMKGPTGVGKTEIARRLAKLVKAPFIKVEATKFTEVGYVGRDVESMIRDLVEVAVRMVREEKYEEVAPKAQAAAEAKIVDALLPIRKQSSEEKPTPQIREELLRELREGKLDKLPVDMTVEVKPKALQLGPIGGGAGDNNIGDFFGSFMPSRKQKRKLTVANAMTLIIEEESAKLIDKEAINQEALMRAEQDGIIFVDELDKVVSKGGRTQGPEVSREGVQRDILPIVEGCMVNTKYGNIRTDFILFIAAGAFHFAKVSDLIPELQGRFPVTVELLSLTQEDFEKILREPDNALIIQYAELLKIDNVELKFTDEAIVELAHIAYLENESTENIGARRLHTLMEKLLEDISFNASGVHDVIELVIDKAYVQTHLASALKQLNLKKYIL